MDIIEKMQKALNEFQGAIHKQRKEIDAKLNSVKYHPEYWLGDVIFIIKKIELYSSDHKKVPEEFVESETIRSIDIVNENRGKYDSAVKIVYSTAYFDRLNEDAYTIDQIYSTRELAMVEARKLFKAADTSIKNREKQEKKSKEQRLKRELKELKSK